MLLIILLHPMSLRACIVYTYPYVSFSFTIATMDLHCNAIQSILIDVSHSEFLLSLIEFDAAHGLTPQSTSFKWAIAP